MVQLLFGLGPIHTQPDWLRCADGDGGTQLG